ncbi:60S ribosomal protein l35 [Pseudohyphozyma bogoriensis]|nr:60S ribosomal protein l35 [Pseudohyphozyma bogoriensis]
MILRLVPTLTFAAVAYVAVAQTTSTVDNLETFPTIIDDTSSTVFSPPPGGVLPGTVVPTTVVTSLPTTAPGIVSTTSAGPGSSTPSGVASTASQTSTSLANVSLPLTGPGPVNTSTTVSSSSSTSTITSAASGTSSTLAASPPGTVSASARVHASGWVVGIMIGVALPMSSSSKVRTSELASKKRDELLKQLEELKEELAQLRVQKINGANSSKLNKISVVRKSIARVLTVVNAKTRQNLRELYKKKKYQPLDLRVKKTRAIRRRLTKHERTQTTERATKKAIHFPKRSFPHPLLTTTLHLAISLVTLLALSFLSRALLTALAARAPRQLTSRSTPNYRRGSLHDALSKLASHAPISRLTSTAISDALTPFVLSSSLAAVLASLVEMRAAKVAEPPFWTLARLLPLVFTFVASFLPDVAPVLEELGEARRGVAILVWLVLMAGPAVGWGTASEGWFCAVVYAVAVMGWVLAVKAGMMESEEVQDDAQKSPPTLMLYLTLATLLLVPPLILSGEFASASKSGHLGFFTEPCFWAQELVMAWCGLASLGAFWGLIKHLDPLALFVTVGLKDAAMPYFYSFFFNNLLRHSTKPALRPTQQVWALIAILLYCVADSWDDSMGEGTVKAQ